MKGFDIPVTLLHFHLHVPAQTYLVYKDGFSRSEYETLENAKNKFFPCSWYLENGEILPYEFCDEKVEYDLEEIEKNLKFIDSKGF